MEAVAINISKTEERKESKFIQNLETNRFGLTTMGMTLQSCLGAISVYYLLQLSDNKDLIPLILIAVITMASNAFMIAQASMKLIFNTFLISILSAIAAIAYALILI